MITDQLFLALGWALKPVFGTTTDAVPLFCYKFRSFLAINGAVNSAGLLLLWWLPPTPSMCALCFVALGTTTAWIDVLCNAYIANAARKDSDRSDRAAAELQSFSIGCFAIGALLGNIIGGLLYSASGSARLCFGLSGIFPLGVIVTAKSMQEEKQKDRIGGERCGDATAIRGVSTRASSVDACV